MSTKTDKTKTEKKPLSPAEWILLLLMGLFLLGGALVFGWFGLTYLPVSQTSEIHARDLEISAGGQRCTLSIPAGTLSLRHPSRTAVGSSYHFDAEVRLESPLRFVSCENGIPNWNIDLEAQTGLVSSKVKPFASIRQPTVNRKQFSFKWTFIPEEPVPQYRSHFWLRAIVTEKDQTIENWNILVRDFPMENRVIFGQAVIFWLIGAAFSILLGLLLLAVLLQMRKRKLPPA